MEILRFLENNKKEEEALLQAGLSGLSRASATFFQDQYQLIRVLIEV